MLKKHNLDDITTVTSPITEVLPANTGPSASPAFITKYLSKVGSLNYPSQMTRLDISFATGVAGRFSSNPNQAHMAALDRVYAYLKGSISRGLTINPKAHLELVGYVDSDHAGCPTTFRSCTGWVFTLADFPISWCSQRQKTVSTSTTEAEYVAAVEASREAAWLKGLINELQLQFSIDQPIKLCIDNNSALKLTRNAEFHSRSKHINIKHHHIRELVENGTINPIRVATTSNFADILTKSIRAPLLNKHLTSLSMAS